MSFEKYESALRRRSFAATGGGGNRRRRRRQRRGNHATSDNDSLTGRKLWNELRRSECATQQTQKHRVCVCVRARVCMCVVRLRTRASKHVALAMLFAPQLLLDLLGRCAGFGRRRCDKRQTLGRHVVGVGRRRAGRAGRAGGASRAGRVRHCDNWRRAAAALSAKRAKRFRVALRPNDC